jgi:hypothetical protein
VAGDFFLNNLLEFPAWLGKVLTCSVCENMFTLYGKDKNRIGECAITGPGGLHVRCEKCGADVHFSP